MKSDERHFPSVNYMSIENAGGNVSPKSHVAEEMQNVFSSQAAKLAERPEQHGESVFDIYCNSDFRQSLMDIEIEEEKRIIKKDLKFWPSGLGDSHVCLSGDLMYELYIGVLISMFFLHDPSFDDVMSSWVCEVKDSTIDLSAAVQVAERLHKLLQLLYSYKRGRQQDSYIYEPSLDYSKSQDDLGQSLNEIRNFVHAPQRIYHKEETENFQGKKIGKALHKKGNSNWRANHGYDTTSGWDDNQTLGNGQGKKYKNKNSADVSLLSFILKRLYIQLSFKADSLSESKFSNGTQYGYLAAYCINFEDESDIIPKTPGQDLGIEMIVVPETKEVHSEPCVDLRKRPPERGGVIGDIKEAVRLIENYPVPIATDARLIGPTAEASVQTDWELDTKTSERRVSLDDVTGTGQTRRLQETSQNDRTELDSYREEDRTARPSFNTTRLRMAVSVREALRLETEQFSPYPSSMHTTETGSQPSVAHETLLATMEAQRVLAVPACTTNRVSSPGNAASGTANTTGIVERGDTHPVQATTVPCSHNDVISVNVRDVSSSRMSLYPCQPRREQSSLHYPDSGSQASCSCDGRRLAGSASSNSGNDSKRRENQPLELPLAQMSVFARLSGVERRHGPVTVYAAGSLPPWAPRSPMIDLTRAASPTHIPLRSRRATFIHWPREETGQQPANMALAGYFYTGRSIDTYSGWSGHISVSFSGQVLVD